MARVNLSIAALGSFDSSGTSTPPFSIGGHSASLVHVLPAGLPSGVNGAGDRFSAGQALVGARSIKGAIREATRPQLVDHSPGAAPRGRVASRIAPLIERAPTSA